MTDQQAPAQIPPATSTPVERNFNSEITQPGFLTKMADGIAANRAAKGQADLNKILSQ